MHGWHSVSNIINNYSADVCTLFSLNDSNKRREIKYIAKSIPPSPKHLRESCQPDGPLSSITLMCIFYKDSPTIRRTYPQCNVKIRKLVLTHYYHLFVRLHANLFPYFPLQEKRDPFQNQVVTLPFISFTAL